MPETKSGVGKYFERRMTKFSEQDILREMKLGKELRGWQMGRGKGRFSLLKRMSRREVAQQQMEAKLSKMEEEGKLRGEYFECTPQLDNYVL